MDGPYSSSTTGSSTSPPRRAGRCPPIRSCSTSGGTTCGRSPTGYRGPKRHSTLSALQAPVPRPRQVFAIGMNYAAHAAEAGVEAPEFPADVHEVPDLPHGARRHGGVAQRVRRLGGRARRRDRSAAYEVEVGEGWSHVAGLTVGQDLSERLVQTRPPAPQFSLGKSFPGFGPTGPWVSRPTSSTTPTTSPWAAR